MLDIYRVESIILKREAILFDLLSCLEVNSTFTASGAVFLFIVISVWVVLQPLKDLCVEVTETLYQHLKTSLSIFF